MTTHTIAIVLDRWQLLAYASPDTVSVSAGFALLSGKGAKGQLSWRYLPRKTTLRDSPELAQNSVRVSLLVPSRFPLVDYLRSRAAPGKRLFYYHKPLP